tara:strand:- start:38 stop:577 length:540 start_codon:yes stop_codon:yes gene_type:complete
MFKVPKLSDLLDFDSSFLKNLSDELSESHKSDVITNARDPNKKPFTQLSDVENIYYKPLKKKISYKRYKSIVYGSTEPNLYASGEMFKEFKTIGKPKVEGEEFSVKYGIDGGKQAAKLIGHLTGPRFKNSEKSLPKRPISVASMPFSDDTVNLLLKKVTGRIVKNFKKITGHEIEVVEI